MMYAKTIFFIVALGGSLYLAGKTFIDESTFDNISVDKLLTIESDESTSPASDSISINETAFTQDTTLDLHASISALENENTIMKDTIQSLQEKVSSLQKVQNQPLSAQQIIQNSATSQEDTQAQLDVSESRQSLPNKTVPSVKSLESMSETANNSLQMNALENDVSKVDQQRKKRVQQLAELRDLSTKRQLAAISVLAN